MHKTRHIIRILFPVILVCAFVFSLAAHAHEPFGGCSEKELPFYGQKLAFGIIKYKEPVVREIDGCPLKNRPQCLSDEGLHAGDEVVIAQNTLGWSCVWKLGLKKIKGWVPEKSITRIAYKKVHQYSLNKWIGSWVYNENTINITKTNQNGSTFLEVDAMAVWNGGNDNVHTGWIKKVGKPIRNVLYIENENICQVFMAMIGNFLVVNDNGNCSGMNVRLDGVYKRK